MRRTYPAPALTADWLNAWLAAIGITVLVPDTRLHWTDNPLPHAMFDVIDPQPLHEQVAAALPSEAALSQLAIARTHPDIGAQFGRLVNLGTYRERCGIARRTGDPSLSLSLTDLAPESSSGMLHSHFDPPAPKGTTLHDRLVALRQAIPADTATEVVERSMTRGGERIKANGLGFDYRRILSPTDPGGGVWVDPVIELLAFFGLSLFPARGDGSRIHVRGWQPGSPGRGSLTWPAWHPPLSAAGIDAMLDQFWRAGPASPVILAVYGIVPYRPRGKDKTRAFASERLS